MTYCFSSLRQHFSQPYESVSYRVDRKLSAFDLSACIIMESMEATNSRSRGKAFFIAILPLLVLLIVLIFTIYVWHFYHPNGTIDLHEGHVSLLHHLIAPFSRFSALG